MFSKALITLPSVMAASWDYKQQGADWPAMTTDYPDCSTGSQSPIDLKNDWKKYLGGNDMWFTQYAWPSTTTRLFGHETIKYSANPALDNGDGVVEGMFFTSGYMLDMGSTGEFDTSQFHIHHPSEHTVEGEQMDMEIHWVHYGKGLFDETLDGDYAIASAAGIMFKLGASVSTEVDAAAAAFLDWIVNDLETDTAQPAIADKSGVSDTMNTLLQAVDWNNRWSYSGSLTTPACTIKVQHNVLQQVLPVTQAQIDAVKAFTIAQPGAEDFYTETQGNYRMIMPLVDAADPVFITDGSAEEEADKFKSLFIAFLVLFIITLLALCIACYMYASASAKTAEPADKKESEMANAK